MKKITPLTLFTIIGCILIILVAVYFTQTIKNTEVENSILPKVENSISHKTTSSINPTTQSGIRGLLNVFIGDYTARLPVFIDNMSAGNVSQDTPLSLRISEGRHTVKVCAGSVCKQVDFESKFGIKTTVDFGELLLKDIPKGLLNVSIGNYSANLPVFIDNKSVGVVSPGNTLNLTVSGGRHTVKICEPFACKSEDVDIDSSNQTIINFEESLINSTVRGPLSISIGGYNAELPVFIDNQSVGVVSQGKPLNYMLEEGNHTVKVCVGIVCENESVEVKFAQQTSINFGERLTRDVEFPTPTVRIVNSFQTGYIIYVDVEFINPDKNDLTMSTTIQCVYSYIDWNTQSRSNAFAQGQLTKWVKAGNRTTERLIIYLPQGYSFIASEPVILALSFK
jgi:hypothetical protein